MSAESVDPMNEHIRSLGLSAAISRRDFLNGVGVAVVSSLLPTSISAALAEGRLPDCYPPVGSGMRGSHVLRNVSVSCSFTDDTV